MSLIELYLSGFSIPDISKQTGVSLSTVRNHLLKAGVLRSRAEGVRLAAKSGKLSGGKGRKRVFTDEWKQRIREAKLKHGEKFAKGVSLKPSGYLEITRGPNKGRNQHVVLMESRIGRRITRGECVHHINGIKSDNRIENLKLMSVSEHSAHHARIRVNRTKRNKKGQFV